MSEVCFIVPCYNEEHRLRSGEFTTYLDRSSGRFFVFVNDGSEDGTEKILIQIQRNSEERVHIVTLRTNQGKAEAVRKGVLHAVGWRRFDLIGYMDADLSTPLDEIDRFTGIFESRKDTLLILGSRSLRAGKNRNEGFVIERGFFLKTAGNAFAFLSSLPLGIRFYDTQCGFKIFRPDLVEDVFQESFISKWIFDVEILARIIRQYGKIESSKIILEHPVREWIRKDGSKIPIYKKAGSLFMLFRIFKTGKK